MSWSLPSKIQQRSGYKLEVKLSLIREDVLVLLNVFFLSHLSFNHVRGLAAIQSLGLKLNWLDHNIEVICSWKGNVNTLLSIQLK